MQFRINCFHDNEGVAMAIRALDPTPPAVENVGFPNGVWQDIIKRPYITIGMTAFLMLTPLAITSNRLSIRKPVSSTLMRTRFRGS